VPPRSLDPSKDLAVYGYGSIAWKERMESWKQKQEKQQMKKDGEDGEDEFDLSVLVLQKPTSLNLLKIVLCAF